MSLRRWLGQNLTTKAPAEARIEAGLKVTGMACGRNTSGFDWLSALASGSLLVFLRVSRASAIDGITDLPIRLCTFLRSCVWIFSVSFTLYTTCYPLCYSISGMIPSLPCTYWRFHGVEQAMGTGPCEEAAKIVFYDGGNLTAILFLSVSAKVTGRIISGNGTPSERPIAHTPCKRTIIESTVQRCIFCTSTNPAVDTSSFWSFSLFLLP